MCEGVKETINCISETIDNKILSTDMMNDVIYLLRRINGRCDDSLLNLSVYDNGEVCLMYSNIIEITCELVEQTYYLYFSDNNKTAIIRMLSELCQARLKLSQIILDSLINENIQYMMDNGDNHSELLYRCLKHIVSDESESSDYEIHLYEEGEYTDVELYDWYLLENCDRNISSDAYVANAYVCFEETIARFNTKLWRRVNK